MHAAQLTTIKIYLGTKTTNNKRYRQTHIISAFFSLSKLASR